MSPITTTLLLHELKLMAVCSLELLYCTRLIGKILDISFCC